MAYRKKRKKKSGFFLLIFLAAVLAVCCRFGIPELIGTYVFPLQEKTRLDVTISQSIVESAPESIPDFSGADYVVLHDNIPCFTYEDLDTIEGEHYSKLDALGRCGTAVAKLDRSMMPTQERGEIGMIRPSGWQTVKYPELIQDRYLYNRCHLIAYAMTGQNANEENLITGTRYMNVSGMLPFEKKVLQYLDYTRNHVLYRVTPYFKDRELVARGVEIEAYSMEDRGAGVCFHVFVYNYQPGIEIDYRSGESRIAPGFENRPSGSR